jgi:DNA-binding XRE family transcriptional regulator
LKIKLRVAEELNEMLIKQGHSKRSFAKSINTGESTIIQIFNGDRSPSPRTAKRICEALECSFDDIFEIVRPKAAAK